MRTLLRTRIRPMAEADLPQIADIERESFTSMWPQTAYKRELSNSAARYTVVTMLDGAGAPHAETSHGGILRTIRRRLAGDAHAPEPGELVLGFVGLWLMVGEAHIVTFAVREDYRRMGIGERLLIEAFDCAIANDQACLTLEVRASNDPARRLYARYGMDAVGVRKRYYTDNNEDAVIMTSRDLFDAAYREQLAHLREEHRARCPDLWASQGSRANER
jgi:ribosomal-protein-alanine N-acetyltransferase